MRVRRFRGGRGHENVRKRVLVQAAGCNLGLLLRRLTGVGTPRSLQGRALSAICGLIARLIDLWGRLIDLFGTEWTPAARGAQPPVPKLLEQAGSAKRLPPRAVTACDFIYV